MRLSLFIIYLYILIPVAVNAQLSSSNYQIDPLIVGSETIGVSSSTNYSAEFGVENFVVDDTQVLFDNGGTRLSYSNTENIEAQDYSEQSITDDSEHPTKPIVDNEDIDLQHTNSDNSKQEKIETEEDVKKNASLDVSANQLDTQAVENDLVQASGTSQFANQDTACCRVECWSLFMICWYWWILVLVTLISIIALRKIRKLV